MSIESEWDLRGMEFAGQATRAVLNAMKAAVRPGVTTRMLDEIAASAMKLFGARSAPQLVYGFPGATCISVNEEVVHGVPSDRPLRRGDLVKLDVTLEVNGYMADACETVAVGVVHPGRRHLVHCAERAFHAGLAVVKPGVRAYEIGIAISSVVQRAGFSVVTGLNGHGIGRTIHEKPTIPNAFDPDCADKLTEGMVFTIEPMIAMGRGESITLKDGWTVRTRDRSLSAHHEHTVLVTERGARLLTA